MKNVFNLEFNERMQVVLMLFTSAVLLKIALPKDNREYKEEKEYKETMAHNGLNVTKEYKEAITYKLSK